MSSCNRRAVLALGVVSLLGGCFRPMLAADGRVEALHGRIALPEIDDRMGYFLYQSLEDRLGTPGATAYRLDVRMKTEDRGLAISQDNAVTRVSVTAVADWALFAEGVAEPVLRDREISRSGYNATGSLYATRQTRLDIERRLARDLGERIGRAILARAGRIEAAAS